MADHLSRLLISVRHDGEVEDAIGGGADILDVKEPARGPLGPASAQTIRAVVARAQGRRPISVAAGEYDQPSITAGVELTYIKVGLAGAGPHWPGQLARHLRIYGTQRFVAVAYADHQRAAAPAVHEVLAWAQHHRAAGFLIDTAVKDGLDLFRWLEHAQLTDLIGQAHRSGLKIGLAGSLDGPSFARAVALGPDVVGVRGAACTGRRRGGQVDRHRVARLASIIAARGAVVASSEG